MPLKVGILMDHPSPHMTSLLDALAQNGDCLAQVVYLANVAPDRSWGAPVGKLPYHFLKGGTRLGIQPGLFHELRKREVDVWVLNTVYTSPSTLLAAWWLSRRSIPWVFMNEPPRPRPFWFSTFKSFLLQFVLNRASGIIGMGEKPQSIYRFLVQGRCPTVSVPYYMDMDPFYQLSLPKLSPGERVRFLTCCRMIPRKGLELLIQACYQLVHLDWQLTLVGDGPLRFLLEKEARQAPFANRIFFKGEVAYEKRAKAFGDAHVFVFPSIWDGWGMVVPEALAAGLPVITTDQVMSSHEFIRNDVNGFMIPANDAQILADRMAYFINHPETIRPMALAARESLKEYKPEIGAKRLVNFLSELVPRKYPLPEVAGHSGYPSPTWRGLTTSGSMMQRAKKRLRHQCKKTWIKTSTAIRSHCQPQGHRILVYHLVLPEDHRTFREQMEFLMDHFQVDSLSEIIRNRRMAVNGNPSFHVALTFDDGFRVLMDAGLNILQKYGIKATFFVSTGFIELHGDRHMAARLSQRAHHHAQPLEPMGPDDLQALVRLGHEVGSHGVTHTGVPLFSKEQALKELECSRNEIAGWTGILPEGFAYPYGQTENVFGKPAEWVQQTGYGYGVTLRRGVVGASCNPYLLPRDHVEGNWPVNELRYFLLK